jgi:hypothetical protein
MVEGKSDDMKKRANLMRGRKETEERVKEGKPRSLRRHHIPIRIRDLKR